jgi:hypothetical protein
MENFIEAFRRNVDGSWSCIRDVTLNGPNGRIQVTAGATFCPGSSFMGVDLARFLDVQARTRAKCDLNH